VCQASAIEIIYNINSTTTIHFSHKNFLSQIFPKLAFAAITSLSQLKQTLI